MGYIIWDTERIRNTKIYMLAYILVDETFERVNQGIIIDSSIDVSKRHSPKRKVEKLKDESLVLNGFKEVSSRILPLLINNIAVCFGKDDFVSFNDQLKIIGSEPLKGEYYDIESFIRDNRIDLPTNLGDAASLLELEHDAHNPLSDSFITLEYFKYLLEKYPHKMLLRPIPNKTKILDIIENGSYDNRAGKSITKQNS